MSATSTLDLSQYQVIWDHNFHTQENLSGFNTVWGDVKVQNGAAVITSTAASGWAKAGFMVTPSGAMAGNGYGLYSIAMALNANGATEGPGGYACLWPSTNNWPGPELDLVEKLDASSGTNGYSTIHWASSTGSNQYATTMLGNIDVTQKHTYAMDWEPGRITLYVDSKEIFTTTHNVPKDYADGGQNEAFGAGEEPSWAASQQGGNTVNQVQVYDINYSAYHPNTSSKWISLSAPGSVQEANVGAGVDIKETISAPGMNTVYVATFDSSNVAEENWQPVTLDSGGNGTFTAHFQKSNDYLVAVSDPVTNANNSWSSRITITDPMVTGSASIPPSSSTTSTTSNTGTSMSTSSVIVVPNDGSSNYTATINDTTLVSGVAGTTVFLTGDGDTLWVGPGDNQTAVVTGNSDTIAVSSNNVTAYAKGTGSVFVANGVNDTVLSEGNNASILLSGNTDVAHLTGNFDTVWSGGDWQRIDQHGSYGTIVLTSSNNQVYDGGSNNTIAMHANSLNNFAWDTVLTNGDKLDISNALAAAGWDGKAADLTNYVSEVSGGWGLSLSVHQQNGAAVSTLNIMGAKADIDLPTLLQHTVL